MTVLSQATHHMTVIVAVMTQRIAEPGYSISSRCYPHHDSTMAAQSPVNCAILNLTIASCQQPSTPQPTTLRLPPCHLLGQEPACRQRGAPHHFCMLLAVTG